MHPEFEVFRKGHFWCVWALTGMILRQSASRAKRSKERRKATFSVPKITIRKRGRPRKQPAGGSPAKSKTSKRARAAKSSPSPAVQAGNETINMSLPDDGESDDEATSAPQQSTVVGHRKGWGDISRVDSDMADSSVIQQGGDRSVVMSAPPQDDGMS
jgi:hypothetical protein